MTATMITTMMRRSQQAAKAVTTINKSSAIAQIKQMSSEMRRRLKITRAKLARGANTP